MLFKPAIFVSKATRLFNIDLCIANWHSGKTLPHICIEHVRFSADAQGLMYGPPDHRG